MHENLDLARRIEAFDTVYNRKPQLYRVTPLTLVYTPNSYEQAAMRDAVMSYMAASNGTFSQELSLLKFYDTKPPACVTPNGMIVPKRNTILEYNTVVRRFAYTMRQLCLSGLIESWHIPLNVRFKSSHLCAENMSRAHPTEHAHSDSWAGESSESVTVHIPILGDTECNYVQMFYPDNEFRDDWLGPRPSYANGHTLLGHYAAVNYTVPRGSVALMDFATLHASTRLPGCGPRVSIDTTFVLKKNGMSEKIHQWREGERASTDILNGIGESHLFYFPDAPDARVDSQGGFKHPTNLIIKRIHD